MSASVSRPTSPPVGETGPIRVMVVDDQATIRLGLRMICDHEPDITVVGEAGDGAAAVAAARLCVPDVVLMDIRMPRTSGIAAIAAIAADPALSHTRTLALTTFDDEEYLAGALTAGASGFLLKDAAPELLIAAIHQVHAGDSVLDPAVTGRVVSRFVEAVQSATFTSDPDPRVALLTAREREVLMAVTRGSSNAEIGAELFCSEATVKSHVRSMLTKLALTNRVQLVVFAYETGLVTPTA